MREVWVCEEGEYEQRILWLIAESVEAGVAAVKAIYGEPYIVRWDDVAENHSGGWTLCGHFEAVAGRSTKHTAEYDFTRYEVVSSDGSANKDQRDG